LERRRLGEGREQTRNGLGRVEKGPIGQWGGHEYMVGEGICMGG
jgi:hypothetical protein